MYYGRCANSKYRMINDSERKSKLLLTKFYGNQHPPSTVFFSPNELQMSLTNIFVYNTYSTDLCLHFVVRCLLNQTQ